MRFFEVEFPHYFGAKILQLIAQQLADMLEAQAPAYTQLHAGQCLWNAVAIETRADSQRLRLVPVILTLVDDTDIAHLANGESHAAVAQDATARLLDEAYQQGALLSMRDIALLTWQSEIKITQYRKTWEEAHQRVLPHPGSLQDMGSCITQKKMIVIKAVYERKDPRLVAQETKHAQKAVDRYLKDFHRVRTCYLQHPDLDFICQVTGMRHFLVKQSLEILQGYEPSTTGNTEECLSGG